MSAIPAEPMKDDIREAGEEQPETSIGNAIFIPVSAPSDPTCKQSMRLVEQSGVLRFWDDPAEDIYTDDDGEPL